MNVQNCKYIENVKYCGIVWKYCGIVCKSGVNVSKYCVNVNCVVMLGSSLFPWLQKVHSPPPAH